jgi:mRNA interferase MazF
VVISSAGEVVLVPFPFSDLSQSKLRPAIALAHVGRGDWILCQITSNPYSDPDAIALFADDLRVGFLQTTSYARPGKLFTAHQNLVASSVGSLKFDAFNRIIDAVIDLLRPEMHPEELLFEP